MTSFTISAGSPAPLGASFDGHGVNFALFSAHAEKVELVNITAENIPQIDKELEAFVEGTGRLDRV